MPAILISLSFLILAAALACAQNNPAVSPAPDKPPIQKISDVEYRLGDIHFFTDSKKITFPASVNQDQDPIEYAIVHSSGKIHESLLHTSISPYHLQVVLLLCGYKPGLGNLFDEFLPPEESSNPAPDPERVTVSLSWDVDGVSHSAPIEDWILNLATGKSMAHGHWAFTGSAVVDKKLQAEVEGSILAIYLDELALLNYPGRGNNNDDIWRPDKGVMPPVESKVQVTITPAPQSPTAPNK